VTATFALLLEVKKLHQASLNLSRVVWDYSSNSLVVVMTHQRLNIGV